MVYGQQILQLLPELRSLHNMPLFPPSPNSGAGSAGTPGSAAPTTTTQIGGDNAGNLVTVNVDSSGNQIVDLQDGSGNAVTSQANGSKRALDVGIDVAGVQIDPRSIRTLTATDIVSVQALSSSGLTVTGTIASTQSGTWTVQPGNTANTTPWLATISQGGNSATVTGSSALKVDGSATTQPVSGNLSVTASSSSGLTINGTVTANAGTGNFTVVQPTGTNLHTVVDSGTITANVQALSSSGLTINGSVTANIGTSGSLALDASVTALQVTQGSTTSGQKGNLVLGSVTTAAPAYTNGQTSPISLTTSGSIRVDGSAVTQPISAASLPLPTGASTSANQTTANTSLASIDGKLTHGQATMANSVPVALASDQSALTPGADISGNGTIGALNATFALTIHGCSSTLLVLSGTWVGSVQIQGLAPDGATWSNLSTQPVPAGSGTFSTALLTTNGVYRILAPADYTQIRALMSAYTSGTATVYFVASSSVAIAQAVQLAAGNLNAQVVGATTNGSGATPNPVIVGGVDSSGNVQNYGATLVDTKYCRDVSVHSGNVISYMACTNGTVTTGTAAANTTSIAYLFHGSGVAKRYEIVRINATISNTDTQNTGDITLRGARITAENGTPGGTSQTINALDQGDAASTGTFRTGATGAPTRATGDYCVYGAGMGSAKADVANGSFTLFDASLLGKPIVIRASTAEGFEVRVVVGSVLATAALISVTFYWREI